MGQPLANYDDLRNLIDASEGDQTPNIQLQVAIDGVESNTVGNVLSRNLTAEDSFISIDGNHLNGVNNNLIIWGENNFSLGPHPNLKNNHDGVNVYVRAEAVIPTLNEWGIIVLMTLLAGAAAWKMNKPELLPA